MSKNEQMKKMLEMMIRKEVQRIGPQIIKEVIAEFMGNLVMETATPAVAGNSGKRRALTEASYMNAEDLEEYPTMPVKAVPTARGPRLSPAARAAQMGYGEYAAAGEAVAPNGKEMIVSSAVTEHGTPIPIDPSELPDHVVDALTKDYTPLMRAMFKS